MSSPLLMTKLHRPLPRPGLVARERLLQRLDEGLNGGHRLALISAPAGFGKTSLMGEWLAQGDRQAAWLTLDAGDNDPLLFLHYLIGAFQQGEPSIGKEVQPLLESPQLPPLLSLVTPLINDLSAMETSLVLVLDDYHAVTTEAVHEVVQFLLEHQPAQLHTIICTREDPPLSLAQWRARGQLTEIRERDLRFLPDETAVFLNETMGLGLPGASVEALRRRTEGWIAGLQLAALAMRESPDGAEDFVAAFTGDNRYIVDYLVGEVLERQPPSIREFLRQTAILDRLNASLCNAITGRDDSQMLLERLDAANLFLISLDHRRAWYRYHQLFADVLRLMVDPGEQATLHRRAAQWYEAQGMMSPAIHHAFESGELSEAERLIELSAEDMLHAGQVVTARGWLDALPEERIRASVTLAAYKGWALAVTGSLAQGDEYAAIAEDRLADGPETAPVRGIVQTLRAFVALMEHEDYPAAIRSTEEALRLLGEECARWRIIALWTKAESLERSGQIDRAIETFYAAQRSGIGMGNQIFTATAEMSLGLILNHKGQRREAVAVCEDALRRYTGESGRSSIMAGLLCNRLGALYYEANDLTQAMQYHEQALSWGRQLGMDYYQSFSEGLAAPTLYAQGDVQRALRSLQQGYHSAARAGFGDADWYLTTEVNLRLRQGDVTFGNRWAESLKLTPDDPLEYLNMERYLAFVRVLLAQHNLPQAQRCLSRLETFTREHGLIRGLLSTLILSALAAARSGDPETAREAICRATELAVPESYYRAFLDEHEQVLALLAGARRVAPGFVDQVLGYAGVPTSRREAARQPLIEPLSDRELEVLALIAEGLSNQEIAHRLYITVGTVKRHINHIYGKLEVGSRTQAIARARSLQLLIRDA